MTAGSRSAATTRTKPIPSFAHSFPSATVFAFHIRCACLLMQDLAGAAALLQTIVPDNMDPETQRRSRLSPLHFFDDIM